MSPPFSHSKKGAPVEPDLLVWRTLSAPKSAPSGHRKPCDLDCPSKGLAYITDYCECAIAGRVLGVGINKEKYEETQGYPSGNRQKYCGTWGHMGHLHFNSQTSGDLNGYPILQKAGQDVAGPSPTYQICKKGGTTLPSKCATVQSPYEVVKPA